MSEKKTKYEALDHHLAALFGDPASADDSELDAVCEEVNGSTELVQTAYDLAVRAAQKYRESRKPVPPHVEAALAQISHIPGGAASRTAPQIVDSASKPSPSVRIILPSALALDEERVGNRIRQVAERTPQVEGTLSKFTRGRIEGFLFRSNKNGEETLIIPKPAHLPPNLLRVVQGAIPSKTETVDLGKGSWLQHPAQIGTRGLLFDYEREIQEVLRSWEGAFSYVQEDIARGIKGLRGPQIGAVHAAHMHWTIKESPATIVMPTGTGKTETMLSILVSAVCQKVLVVVPTDALRTQIAEKFLTLGVLKEPDSRVLSQRAKYPIVSILQHIPKNIAEVDEVFGRSNVIVTTSAIAGQCDTAVQDRMASQCTHLFIDEAHHAEAPTWSAFKDKFKERRILQFTATPFREDGRHLDGDIIYRYPLSKAQREGYFKPIRFRKVVEFNRRRADQAIADAAIQQLRTDFEKGHILMARAETVARAAEIFRIYEQYSEFKPVQLHTGIKSERRRDEIRRQIICGESRIVVCVDMLGEGFDLPELKIAAFHDIRKTLAVTLQLAGRFTRSRPDLGDATFIANIADIQVRDELRKLYSRDPDWNILLPDLSERMIGEQISLQEFLRGFVPASQDIPLRAVRPATSTVVYHTRCCDWSPEKFREGVPGINGYEQVHETVNREKHTLVAVMGRRTALPWADVDALFDWNWDLYVVIWSPDQDLLFINSSSNSGEYESIAKAVAGEDVSLIHGQDVFRTLAGINRLRLQNVGLTEQLGRNIRYTGRMGGDVEPALTDLQRGRGRKSVLFGTGYEGGESVTIGASRKGRIWSHRRDRVDQLREWCQAIGAKLLDRKIDPDEVVKGTLNTKTVKTRPPKMPFWIDWPEEIYATPEAAWVVSIDGEGWSLAELSIELDSPSLDGPLRFAVVSETTRAEFELQLFEDGELPNYRFLIARNHSVKIGSASFMEDAAAFFYQNPPTIWFVDGSSLEGNQQTELRNGYPPFDVSKIRTLDWGGVDLRKESQGPAKDKSSVQARVISGLARNNYSVIFDDDGKGEIADIVTIRTEGDQNAPSSVEVELYHCKYSHGDKPGRRIEDLYEVCGQAQKSIAWVASPDKKTDMFTHLLRRESMRRDSFGPTRFEIGDEEQLLILRDISRLLPVNFKICIVQPGVSKANASPDQLALLGVTENYLAETRQIRLTVITSE